jgi:acetyl-CoA carboxylase biotin carboxyl carrier protein
MPMPTLLPAAPAPPLPAPPAAVAASADGDTSGQPESSKSKLLEVKSPMVGTFYAAPEPGSDPYVAEGTRIAKGQILCIIEAMKIMNEIESEFSGVVREVLVQDAHPVEYGQVLFRVDPNG